MASLSSLGLHLRLADIDENLRFHPTALSWPPYGGGLSTASRSRGFVDDAPYFAYNEVFESGDTFKAISHGSGIYMPLHSSSGPNPAFTLSKCRLSRTIDLEVQSLSLLQSLAIAMPSPFDFPSVLASYSLLKSHLEYLETISPAHPTTAEFRLLVRDLLLDRALFAGIGTEFYFSQGLLGLHQLHDMHQRSVDAGLDDIDACFSLGLLPDAVTDEYLERLVSNFRRLALAGDLTALRDLCEPVVRSGEIQWQSNPDLLLELLNLDRLDIYQYVLDLASRTRDDATDDQDGSRSQLKDITNDPFHMAIQLGHAEHVEGFLQRGASFLGLYEGEEPCTPIVLAPLSAAAFWGQPSIARLILRYSPLQEGGQQAAVIACSNNDEEMMQVLLSFGVIGPPITSLTDDTAESFVGLSIMDQGLEMPQKVAPGFGIEERKHLTATVVNDPTQPHRPQKAPSRPRKRPPKEPIRPKERRQRRHLLGRNLVSVMGSLCSQLRNVCSTSTHAELRDFGQDYIYENGVWRRGLDVFRGLMQDSPPSTLDQVVDALLVANAVCLAFQKDNGSLLIQFYNDLHRWRAVLPGPSHALFDDLAFRMWAFVPGLDSASDADPVGVPRFQGLIQSLLSLEARREDGTSRSSATGTRLSAVHRVFERQESRHEVVGAQAIPGRSQSRQQHSSGASSTQQDDFMWSDFLNMDSFEDATGELPKASVSNWEHALSSTLMLLASVAFSIILSLIIGLHSSSSTRIIQVMAVTSPGFARSCILLTEYLAMHGVSTRTEETIIPAPITPVVPPSPAYGPNTGLTPASSFSSLSTLGMRRNVSSSSVSSIGSNTAAPTPSRPPSRDQHQPRGGRLTCPVPQCTKMFSSVSNRNKHVREGCAYNREKRQGYPCRNAPCPKIVTTSWYRDTHERERCRFRRSD
ncbi:ankyrin repeat protein [Colletotrichum plurivorum]|uniref:Ankyrin repeat protein n=1 Tax=Colletotrichum plurivorum TaxID=2175906 RepID=A0A8H6NF87_9PEZI|nr:ankyrin repeat protein [Colletotrichum plurivorum]